MTPEAPSALILAQTFGRSGTGGKKKQISVCGDPQEHADCSQESAQRASKPVAVVQGKGVQNRCSFAVCSEANQLTVRGMPR
eukprot:1994079-Rhodomonas_salina.2